MAYREVSPGELEGDELERWYRRSPGEIEAERARRAQYDYEEFFGGGRWQEARNTNPRVAIPPTRVAPPVSRGRPTPSPGTFFSTYPSVAGAYFPQRPYPLNTVEHVGGDEFRLADGSVVRSAELERIYAEQGQRMAGAHEEQIAPRVRRVDRVPIGKIPDAATMAQDEREDDPSCHPYGGGEREQPDSKRSQRSRDYEAQISRAPGLNYVVRTPDGNEVAFDGCAVWDPRRQLLEAKGPGYAGLAAFMEDSPKYADFNAEPGLQAELQARAARGRPVDWHIAEKGAVPFFRRRVEVVAPNLKVRHTPPKAKWRLF